MKIFKHDDDSRYGVWKCGCNDPKHQEQFYNMPVLTRDLVVLTAPMDYYSEMPNDRYNIDVKKIIDKCDKVVLLNYPAELYYSNARFADTHNEYRCLKCGTYRWVYIEDPSHEFGSAWKLLTRHR